MAESEIKSLDERYPQTIYVEQYHQDEVKFGSIEDSQGSSTFTYSPLERRDGFLGSNNDFHESPGPEFTAGRAVQLLGGAGGLGAIIGFGFAAFVAKSIVAAAVPGAFPVVGTVLLLELGGQYAHNKEVSGR